MFDKSKIFKLENKIKKGIYEHIFLNKNLDLLEKSDKKLKIYSKKKKEIQLRHKKCLNELSSNIINLIEIKSIIKKNNLIEDRMKIENYDITKLADNKKSDFKDILNDVNNYINQEFNYSEYINKLEKLGLTDYLIEKDKDKNYTSFLLHNLFELKNKIIKKYLNIYKKDDFKDYIKIKII